MNSVLTAWLLEQKVRAMKHLVQRYYGSLTLLVLGGMVLLAVELYTLISFHDDDEKSPI